MSERKSINKYYPPDYNPLEAENALQKASKNLKSKNRDSVTIRLMTPFSMRCLKCSEYIPKSRKFNGKKEVLKEKYLDTIKIYRFAIKCPRCNNMLSFRTDPKSADYVMEFGGKRNYEPAHTDTKIESVTETLDRLTSEQKKLELGDAADDKMEALELKLSKLEKERQDDEELENIRRAETMRRSNEQRLRESAEDADGDLDRLAEEALAQRRGIDRAPPPVPTPRIARAPLKIGKKRKKNPLGVTLKKR